MQNHKQSFKKDVLVITCGIVVGCVLFHNIHLQLASWLKLLMGGFGGGLFTYVLRLCFEPERIKKAKGKEIKWQRNKQEFFEDVQHMSIIMSGFTWAFNLIIFCVAEAPFKDGLFLLLISSVSFHVYGVVVVMLSCFAKQEESYQKIKKSTFLKWNFISLPFSVLYYVGYEFLIKIILIKGVPMVLRVLGSFAKFVHSSTFTSCAIYTMLFTLIVATITSDIIWIISLAVIGGIVGAKMRHWVPKWFHWELPVTSV